MIGRSSGVGWAVMGMGNERLLRGSWGAVGRHIKATTAEYT